MSTPASGTPADAGSEAAAGSEPVVKVTNLVAGYLPGVNILNGCSIEARQGELIGDGADASRVDVAGQRDAGQDRA